MTMDTAGATVSALTMCVSGTCSKATTLTLTQNLTVTGAVTINAPGASITNQIVVNTSTLSAGSIAIAGSSTNRIAKLGATTGKIILTGSGISFSGTAAQAQLTTTGAATIQLTGTNSTIGTGGTISLAAGTNLTSSGATDAVTYATAITTWGTITVSSGQLTLSGAAETSTGVSISSGATLTDGGNSRLLTVTGNYANSGTHAGTGGVTVSGASSVISGTSGAVTNTGTFTISGTTAPSISSGSTLTFSGTVSSASTTNNGTVTVNAATSLSGTKWINAATGVLNIGSASAPTITTLTATASGNTVNYNLAGAQTVFSTNYYNLTLSGSGGKTLQSGTTAIGGNLTLSGTATSTTAANLTITGNLSVGDGTTLTVGAFTLTVSSTTTVGGGSSGTLTFSSATNPSKTFTGLVTINGGANWTESAAVTSTFSNGITNSGTFTASTGVHTFSTNSQALTGTFSIPSVTVTGVTLTNNGTLTVATALAGTGGLTNAGTSTLNIGATGANLTITTLTATASGNIVNYTATAPTCEVVVYDTLNFTGSGAITCALTTVKNLALSPSDSMTWTLSATLAVSGTLTVNSPGTVTNNGTVTITGNFTGSGSWIQGSGSVLNVGGGTTNALAITTFDGHTNANTVNYDGAGNQTVAATTYSNLTISDSGFVATLGGSTTVNGTTTISSGTLDVSGNSYALNLNGNFTNSGTFTARSGTVTLGGTGQQLLSGTMTGTSAFYDLIITNHSGAGPSDCELTGFTPSVAFLASASSTDNYTITTGDVGIQYHNGSTYTFVNTDWVGPSGHPVYFRNSAGSGTWLLNVSGTQTPLAYVNVSRSDASSGSAVNAANITNRDCGNNTHWTFGSSVPPATAYTQVGYTWFANQNSANVGSALASQNASTTLSSTGEAFRLRMLLAVDATNSIAGTDSFMLQFANKGNGANCASPQYGYATITSSTAIAYNTNSLVQNGTALSPTSSDPVDGGRTVVGQTYQSANNFSVTSTIYTGQDGNWDFSLVDNGAPGTTDYCFQAVFSSSTALYAYPVYPEIVTHTNPSPTVSNVHLNGDANITLLPATTETISVVASTSDPGGPGNIISATSTIYRTSRTASCTADGLNCYQIGSPNCVFSGSTSTVTCSADMWYFAQSTGASSSFPSDSWTAAVTVTNGGGYTATATSGPVNVNVLIAINVTTSSINYGTITASTTSQGTNQTTTIQNVGNSSTTIEVSGTAFISGSNSFATTSQHYATSSFTFGTGDTALTDSAIAIGGLLFAAPTSTTPVQGNVLWGIGVPAGIPTGTYQATTTFTAVNN